MDVVTLSTNLIYKFKKKGGDNLRGTMLLETFCFVFVCLKWDLQVLLSLQTSARQNKRE